MSAPSSSIDDLLGALGLLPDVVPVAPSLGEFLGSGGGDSIESSFVGMVESSESSDVLCVGIFVVRDPSSVCGGVIGTKGTQVFCINDVSKMGCKIKAHRTKKITQELSVGDIFVKTGRARQNGAFLFPTINVSKIPLEVRDSFTEDRPYQIWMQIIGALNELDGEETTELVEVTVLQAASQANFAPTPFLKRSQRFMDEADEELQPRSLDMEIGPNEPGRSSWFEKGSPGKRRAINLELLSSFGVAPASPSEDQLPTIIQGWSGVVRVVQELVPLVNNINESVSIIETHVDTVVGSVNQKIGSLHASLGRRSAEVEGNLPPQVWSSVGALLSQVIQDKGELENFKRRYEESQMAAIAEEDTKQAKLLAVEERLGQTHQLIGLLVGERAKVQALERRLEVLETSISGDYEKSSPVVELSDAFLARADRLEMELSSIRSSLGGEVVRINDVPYHSVNEIEEWVIENMGEGASSEFWYDIVSMMESIVDVNRSSEGTMDIKTKALRSGAASLAEGRVINSFTTTVPEIFNISSKTGKEEDFSGVATFLDWDGLDRRTGLVPRINADVLIWHRQQQSSTNIQFPPGKRGAANLLAQQLIQRTMFFWNELVTWINGFYNRLTHPRTGKAGSVASTMAEVKEMEQSRKDVETEAWTLIKRILSDIFRDLAHKRADGKAAQQKGISEQRRCSIVLYSTLKAHAFMLELSEKSFERHPCMAPTFNAFLFMERASIVDTQRLDTKIGTLEKMVGGLQKTINQLESKNAKKQGGGGRGGGGQGGGGNHGE